MLDIVATLTALKAMGIEIGAIMGGALTAYIIMKPVIKRLDNFSDHLTVIANRLEALTKLVADLEAVHNKRLETIENQLGLKNKGG